MPSDSGTVILQDDGSVTLDEDGNVLVSDGTSDCDCCGLPADCCTVFGCTFDKANARLQGNFSIQVTEYASNSCSGAVVNTCVIEGTFDIQMNVCGGTNGDYRIYDTSGTNTQNNPDTSRAVFITLYQINGVDIPITGTSFPQTTYVGIQADYSAVGQWTMDGYFVVPWTGGQVGFNQFSPQTVTGDCTGFDSQPYYYCNGGGTDRVQSSIDLTVVNNTRCP